MTKYYQNIALWLLLSLLITACSKDGADGNDVTKTNEETPKEITLNPTIWQMIEGTRATTYDAGILTSGSFTAAAYEENTTTAYISPVTVNYVTDKWVFSDGKHYWPASGNLDFFGYMPATTPSYISALTYSATSNPVAHSVTFGADLSSGASTEFVFALTTGQNKTNAASGVALNFLHPFARVKFAIGTIPSTVTVNSVSLGEVMMAGSYSYSYEGSTSTWSGQSKSGSIGGLDEWIITVPYSNGSKTLTVNCTWSNWSNVTKDLTASITADWAVGTSYSYTLNISKDYALTVSSSKYTEQW